MLMYGAVVDNDNRWNSEFVERIMNSLGSRRSRNFEKLPFLKRSRVTICTVFRAAMASP